MSFGENRLAREARLARQKTAHPELNTSDTETVFAIDRLRREEGRTPTSLGTALEQSFTSYSPEPSADEPDVSPNVLPWGSPPPTGAPDPYSDEALNTPAMPPGQGYYRASASFGEALRGLNPFQNFTNAAMGAASGSTPIESLSRAAQGFNARTSNAFPEPLPFSWRDAGFVRHAPEANLRLSDVVPPTMLPDRELPFSPRDVGAVGAEMAFDPLNVLPLSKARGFVGIANEAAEAASKRTARQFGRTAGDDLLMTAGPRGEALGVPTGGVMEMRLGREPVMGENVNRGIRETAAGRARVWDDVGGTAVAGGADNIADYQGHHTPPLRDTGAPLHDLTGGGTIYPDDVYGADGARVYGTGDRNLDRQAFRIINQMKGKPDAMVTVYRAIPASEATAGINPGDWVTTVRDYAQGHGDSWLGGESRIVSRRVKASELFTNGDSPMEYGYDPSPPRPIAGGADTGDVLAARIPNPLPAPVSATVRGPAEAGTRTGNLLRPRGLEQLGPDANVSSVIGVSNDLRRQVGSQTVSLEGDAQNLFEMLGPTVKDAKGNVYLRDVIKADGAPALLQDVVERPSRYPLTPRQETATTGLQRIASLVHEEPRTFGVAVRDTPLDPDQGYFPRFAAEDTKGNVLTRPFQSGSGAKLRTLKEQSRQITDAALGAQSGVVYEHPQEALSRYIRSNLDGAANQHIAEMFKTFGETPAVRVPAALRSAHDGLAKSLVSLKGTVGRLDNRLETVVDSYLRAPVPDLDALLADLDDIKVGRNAVGVAGANFGKTPPQLRFEISRVQQQIKNLRPAWKAATEQAKQIPSGRAGVTKENASALIGHDFPEADAKRITRYYSNGIIPDNNIGTVLRAIKGFNQKVIPMQAIGDASATLRQLGTVLPSHPIQFAKNFGTAGYESLFPGGMRHYNQWLSSPEVRDAASHGVSLVGGGGNATTDFMASWIERVPGLKQTQQHFQIIGNRNRVDLYLQDIDMLRRTGQRVDEQVMEQVGRNANRITGVSNVRATDAETLTEFAANYMRSKIETLTKALSDGSIEGQLARQYLKNYVSTGMIAVAGVAAAQGRDLRDVLNPITVDERTGRFRLNPNFGTVRFAGQDWNVFGTYIDLVRMSMVAADGAYGAIKERDATQLVKGIYQAAEAKAAPALSTARDVTAAVLGNEVFGQDPRTWTYWLTRYLPINAGSAVRDLRAGVPPATEAAVQGIQFFGGASSPLSPTELLDEQANRRWGKDYYDLEPSQRKELDAANPDIMERRAENASPEAKVSAAFLKQAQDHLAAADRYLAAGKTEAGKPFTPKDWRETYHDIQDALRYQREGIYANAGKKPGSDPILDGYFKAIEDSKDGTGQPDFDQVDAYRSKLTPADQAYIDRNTGLTLTSDTSKEYKAATKRIADSGYWDLSDDVAVRTAGLAGLSGVTSMATLQRAAEDKYRAQYGDDGHVTDFGKRTVARANQLLGKEHVKFLREHTDLIPLLSRWGYGVPKGATQGAVQP